MDATLTQTGLPESHKPAMESGSPQARPPVIEAERLARWYGRVAGLTDLDVKIPPGITGLLGPNGAGKSTFLRLLTGLMVPSTGKVRVLGKDPLKQPEVFCSVGFCSEDDSVFDDLTPLQMVTFLARCSGIAKGKARSRAMECLEIVGLTNVLDRKTGGFSKGMRQRTRIAAALVHDPEILLLDEPMTGLDPLGRRDVVQIIRTMAAKGKSVLFSSHILHEVESVAEYVIVLNRGMLLAEGSLPHIRECLSDYAFTLHIASSDPRQLATLLAPCPYVVSLIFGEKNLLKVGSDSARTLLQELPRIILSSGIEVHEIDCPGESLEMLFQRLTK